MRRADFCRGFTLLEVMIALAVISGLLLTLLGTVNYLLGVAERHEVLTMASFLAKDKMYQTEKTPVSSNGNFPEPYTDYAFRTEIKESLYPGMSELTVIVKKGKETVILKELIGRAKI